MKIDIKIIIICILTGALLFLGGYIIGNRKTEQSALMPASPKISKDYKDLVAKEVRSYSQDISGCYKSFLETKPTISEGKIDLVFLVANNGIISEIEIAKNELSSESLSECVKEKLTPMRLPPLPQGLNPYISHSLAFKSEETLKKEMEENKNRIPKVLPVE